VVGNRERPHFSKEIGVFFSLNILFINPEKDRAMILYEHEAKRLFKEQGIPSPSGELAKTL